MLSNMHWEKLTHCISNKKKKRKMIYCRILSCRQKGSLYHVFVCSVVDTRCFVRGFSCILFFLHLDKKNNICVKRNMFLGKVYQNDLIFIIQQRTNWSRYILCLNYSISIYCITTFISVYYSKYVSKLSMTYGQNTF